MVSESIEIAAPASRIFDTLADPRRHVEIDGSHMLRRCLDGPDRLGLGPEFVMSMRCGVFRTGCATGSSSSRRTAVVGLERFDRVQCVVAVLGVVDRSFGWAGVKPSSQIPMTSTTTESHSTIRCAINSPSR